VAPGATLKLNGTSSEALDARTLRNLGHILWSGPNDLTLSDGASLVNAPGATFTVQNGRSILAGPGATSLLSNAGTFIKSTSADTATLNVPFTNTGTLQVQTGTLALAAGLRNAKTVSVAAGRTLQLSGPSRLGGTVSGPGTVTFGSGTTEVPGSFNLT